MDRRVHDRGGWPGAGAIYRAEHALEPWEKQVKALFWVLPGIRVDELRRVQEALLPEEYEALGYYERWVEAIEALLVEKKMLAPGELVRWIEEVEGPQGRGTPSGGPRTIPPEGGGVKDPRFGPGDRVRVKQEFQTRHHRTPGYAQGRVGVVTAVHGRFRNPESLAYGGDGLPERFLYSVVFEQTDLWKPYDGVPGDKVVVDLYEHWLEPIEEGR